MKRHPLDLLSLVAGLATLAVAVVLLVPGVETISISRLIPAAIIAIGVALLLSGRSGNDSAASETADAGGHDDQRDGGGTTDVRAADPAVDVTTDVGRSDPVDVTTELTDDTRQLDDPTEPRE